MPHTGALALPTPPVSTPTHDYADLKRHIKQAGLLAKQPRSFTYTMTLILLALLAGFLALFLVHNLWFQLLNALYLAVVLAQIGFLGHDVGHRQPFSSTRTNELAGLLFGNLLIGISNAWWVDKHNQHHSHPNQLDLDPDLNIPGICFNLSDARQKRGLERWIMLHQVWLFFPMLLLVAIDMKRSGLLFLLKEWRSLKYPVLEIALVLAHWILFPLLLISSLGLAPALLFFVVNQAALGFILGSAFAPNHKGMPVLEKDSDLSFLQRQVITARNIHAGALTDFWYGGLNYQIEHHLFPSMPRKNLRRAQFLVKHYCQEHDIPYTETSILGSYRALIQALSEISLTVRNEQN